MEQKQKWTDDQIRDLLKQANALYGTEIPIMAEINHIDSFLWDLSRWSKPEDSYKLKLTGIAFSWFPKEHKKEQSIDLPVSLLKQIISFAREELNKKCDYLKDIMGKKYFPRQW